MSQNDFKTSEIIEPQEASPMQKLPATRHAVVGHYLIPAAPALLATLRAPRDRCCYR